MIRKNKVCLYMLSILFCIFFISNIYSANAGGKFITPNLEINGSGIRFNNNSTENSFKKSEDEVSAINAILREYRIIITFCSGVVSLTMIGLFISNLIKLGNSKGNPQARSKAVTALIFTGIATAMAGSVTTIVGLFYNFL